ncbi:hypothetical protein VTJ04DRAFT_6382 [Mycothermus thermophilus]|uniref:uncharacterized protein n=1 Tax=Humicola insolens TaxID=85995 RepID=UPI0037435268
MCTPHAVLWSPTTPRFDSPMTGHGDCMPNPDGHEERAGHTSADSDISAERVDANLDSSGAETPPSRDISPVMSASSSSTTMSESWRMDPNNPEWNAEDYRGNYTNKAWNKKKCRNKEDEEKGELNDEFSSGGGVAS